MGRSHPSFRQLECFVAVADLSSYRRAAERLRASQPTLTNQIAALEASLGIQLFERSRAGTVLTPMGRELLPGARRVLEEVRGFVDHAESASRGPAGTYRLGVTPTLGPYLLPHVLPVIHERYSALRLYVREGPPRVLEAGLASGDFDLILTSLPIEEPRLTSFPLFRETLKLVVPAEHRLATVDPVERTDLVGESVLTIEVHHQFHRQIADLCERLGAHVRRDYEGTSLDSLRQMIVMGMGIAFLPALYIRSEIHRPRELRVTTVKDEVLERTHAVVWRATSPSRALFRELAYELQAKALRDFADDLRPVAPPSGADA